MGALLRNEWIKLARMKKLYIFALFMFAILVLNLYNYEPGGSELTVWTFSYGQSVPMAVIEIFAQFMIIFIPIMVGDSIAHEYKQGTLKLSLLRPVARSELLSAKLISLLAFMLVMMLIHLLMSYLAGAYFLGWGAGTEYAGALFTPGKGLWLTLGAYALLLFPLFAYGMFAACVAIWSGNRSFTMIGTLVLVTIALQFNMLAFAAPYSLAYYLASFYESFTGTASWMTASRASGVVMLYLALFGTLAYYSFCKKEFVQ